MTIHMLEDHGFRLSSAQVLMRGDRCIHFSLNSPNGRVPCLLLTDAVDMMAERFGPERAWAKINRDWSDQITVIAANKYSLHPDEPVVISADDLTSLMRH
jgi:hypothetical protein